MRDRRRPGAVAPILAGPILVASLLAGCSDGDTTDATASSTTTTAAESAPATTTTPEAEAFTGAVDEFYVVPDPLPSGKPGTLIRTQVVGAATDRTTRIMYHSIDGAGRDRAVTGTVTLPAGGPPVGGWPVVTIAPGTVGLTSGCAQSRNGTPPLDVGVDAVRVMTDYIGMGPVGETMPYLSRESEGHSVLDAARAAREIADGRTSTALAIVGHSQGGHGAQSAHELAGEYAPELDLVGTVSLAPAAMFDRTYGGVDDIVSRIVSTMSIYGLATEHPDVDPAQYLTPEAAAAMVEAKDPGCPDTIINALVPFAASAPYWAVDPFAAEPSKAIMTANDVGNVDVDAPLLLIGGTADERVVEARVRDLYGRLCATGQATQFVMLDGATHGTEVPVALPQITQWLTDRFAGKAAPDDCATASP